MLVQSVLCRVGEHRLGEGWELVEGAHPGAAAVHVDAPRHRTDVDLPSVHCHRRRATAPWKAAHGLRYTDAVMHALQVVLVIVALVVLGQLLPDERIWIALAVGYVLGIAHATARAKTRPR